MTKKFKRLSKARSLTLPRDLAAQLDMGAGTAVDLTATQDGKLVIKNPLDCSLCRAWKPYHSQTR